MEASTMDLFDLSRIYASDVPYSYPQHLLEDHLKGKGFGQVGEYSAEEEKALRADICEIWEKTFSSTSLRERRAIITAGAPGAGKTILLEALRKKEEEVIQTSLPYIDPDAVCLKNQRRTFCQDIERGGRSIDARRDAYNKWRPGSNGAAHLILANLIAESRPFYFGTTSTAPKTASFFEFLKKRDYHINLIHLTACDAVRVASIKKRDEEFIQTTDDDIVVKGVLLPERIMDTYLLYADCIEFWYRDGVESEAILGGIWTKTTESELSGRIKVVHKESFENVKVAHNLLVTSIGRPDLLWENTVDLVSTYEDS